MHFKAIHCYIICISTPCFCHCCDIAGYSFLRARGFLAPCLSGTYLPCGWKSSDGDRMDPCQENVDDDGQ
ncbi:unnamed protein product [Citrullus colocynthis]|uniref:Secreted protein n=1 Tax=Citrullus colocynthis TaxID=252529 RepID=A0ABP0YIA1_9ROSI